jgi:hypothetical protein
VSRSIPVRCILLIPPGETLALYTQFAKDAQSYERALAFVQPLHDNYLLSALAFADHLQDGVDMLGADTMAERFTAPENPSDMDAFQFMYALSSAIRKLPGVRTAGRERRKVNAGPFSVLGAPVTKKDEGSSVKAAGGEDAMSYESETG